MTATSFLLGCVTDIDFDEITPRCEAPNIDALHRSVYCGARLSDGPLIDLPTDRVLAVGSSSERQVALVGTSVDEVVIDDEEVELYDGWSLYLTDPGELEDQLTLATPTRIVGAEEVPDPVLFAVIRATPAPATDVVVVTTVNEQLFVLQDGPTLAFDRTRIPGASTRPDLSASRYIDVTVARREMDLLVVAAVINGVKVFLLREEGGVWSEAVPELSLPAGPMRPSVLSRANQVCARACGSSPQCVRFDECHVWVPPGGQVGSVATNDDGSLVYVGGLGSLVVYDTNDLVPDDEGTFSESPQPLDAFDLATATGEFLDLLPVAVEVGPSSVYILTVSRDALEESGNAPASLFIVELDEEGLMDRFGSETELPSSFVVSERSSMEWGDDLLVIKSHIGPEPQSPRVASQRALVLDVINDDEPQVLYTATPNADGEFGLDGVVHLQHGRFVLPSGSGVHVIDADVPGTLAR